MNGWKIIGPGGGGTTYNPTISPHDPKTIFTHCDMTGNYLSKDAGRTWKNFNINGGALGFCYDPTDEKIMYAGGNGIYKSIDGGESWRRIYPRPEESDAVISGDHGGTHFIPRGGEAIGAVRKITIDPSDNKIVYVLTAEPDFFRIYVTRDAGESFNILGDAPYCEDPGAALGKADYYNRGSQAVFLYADPASPDKNRSLYIFQKRVRYLKEAEGRVSYAGEIGRMTAGGKYERLSGEAVSHADCFYDKANGKSIFYVLRPDENKNMPCVIGALYRTADFISYDKLTNEIDVSFMAGSKLAGKHDRLHMSFVGAGDNKTVYVSLFACEDFYGVIKTADGGASWSWCFRNAFTVGDPECYGNFQSGWLELCYHYGWGAFPWGFAVSKKDPDYVYFSNMGAFHSTEDGGKTWNSLYSNIENKNGRVFTKTTGLDVTNVYQAVFDPFDKNHIVLSDTDIGQFKSIDGGEYFTHTIDGVPHEWRNTNYWTIFDPAVKGCMWSAWSGTHDMPRLKVLPPRNNMSESSVHYGGVCRSEDGGYTWAALTGKNNPASGMPESVVTMIALDPESEINSRVIYAATMGRGVYKSSDGGKTWAQKNNGLSPVIGKMRDGSPVPAEYGIDNIFAWAVYVRYGKIYLSVARSGAEGACEGPGQLYVSCDGAESWQKLKMPGNVNFVNDLAFDPNEPNLFYAACWKSSNSKDMGDYRPDSGGVYLTEDGGLNWKLLWGPEQCVFGLAIDPDDPKKIYAVTFHGSLMKSSDRGATWEKVIGYDFYWGHRPFIDPAHKGFIYVTTFGGGVWHGPA